MEGHRDLAMGKTMASQPCCSSSINTWRSGGVSHGGSWKHAKELDFSLEALKGLWGFSLGEWEATRHWSRSVFKRCCCAMASTREGCGNDQEGLCLNSTKLET